MKKCLLLGVAALFLTSAVSIAPVRAQNVKVEVAGCGPQGFNCTLQCPKNRQGKQLKLALAVCNDHGEPGEKEPGYGSGKKEIMPVFDSAIKATCTSTRYGFGGSMYGICVVP